MNVLSFFFHPHFVVGTVDDKTHSLLNSDCWWLVSGDDDDDKMVVVVPVVELPLYCVFIAEIMCKWLYVCWDNVRCCCWLLVLVFQK